MKISLKWMSTFVDIGDQMAAPEHLADILNAAGLEVESIENRSKDFQNVVVGHILEKGKHPDADKLSLCQVSTGQVNGKEQVHQIVCGATNHKAGDKVIVALPGAVLPGGFAIKKAQVRGVDSSGMLCSKEELGLEKKSDGILILPVDAPVGKPAAEYLGFDDVVFELKVTPNRADCLSHFGLAREVACLLSRDLKPHKPEMKLSSTSTKSAMALEVTATDLCPRYSGRYIKGVKVGPSPDWLVKSLESVGMASINNVVDITNFVMMELGQPMHAFDANLISGAKILVNKAVANEKFVKLDGTEITLTGEELMIRDAVKPIALAGVVGGKNSGVSDSTVNIFLESAYFLPMVVRKTSRRHGIDTDSAYRFSRGVDSAGAVKALDRATELVLQLCGGEAFSDHHDVYPAPVVKKPVKISVQTVTDRLGYQADEAKFVDYMKRLGCEVKGSAGQYEVLPPSFRFDLEIDMDLVEEYARLFGYQHIPDAIPVPLQKELPAVQDKVFLLNKKVNEWMRSSGYQQAFNTAFADSKKEFQFLGPAKALNLTGLSASEEKIRILNPLNEEMDVMRSTLSFGLFKNLSSNFHYGNHFGRLFEIGVTFSKKEQAYIENTRLGLALWGHAENLWQKQSAVPLVMEAKAAIESLLSDFNISAYTWVVPKDKSEIPDFLHKGQYASLVVEGKKVGFVGSLHPVIKEEEKIRVEVALAEFDLEVFYRIWPRPYRAQGVSKFPMVERDLAFVMDKKLPVGDLVKSIRKSGGVLLKDVQVFDVYQGDKMETGKKSVAFRLNFLDENATLQEQSIQELCGKVTEQLKKEFAVTMRL